MKVDNFTLNELIKLIINQKVEMTTTQKGMQKYELKGVVGEGAYGKVFMARNKETGEVGKYSPATLCLTIRFSPQSQSRNSKSPMTMRS